MVQLALEMGWTGIEEQSLNLTCARAVPSARIYFQSEFSYS